jgi:hypothetical protein
MRGTGQHVAFVWLGRQDPDGIAAGKGITRGRPAGAVFRMATPHKGRRRRPPAG